MIVRKDSSRHVEVEVRVKFMDDDGNEVTKHDNNESYKQALNAALAYIGMMMSCGDGVGEMVEDLGVIGAKAMARAVASGFVPLEEALKL